MPSGTAFSTLAVGMDHTLAIDRSGAVWGWGANRAGLLGDASRVDRSTPVRAHLPDGVAAADVGPPNALVEHATVWDARFLVDWGRFDSGPAPGVPQAVGFEGIVSETGVSLTYAPVGGTGSWMIDVVVSAVHPKAPSIADDVALVSVFPLGVVSLAVPEPVWVGADGIVLEVFDARTGSWIPVQDSYRRPGAEALLWDWVDGAFLAVDVLSLAVPKLQLLKLLLMLPRVMEEYKEAEWEAALDPARVLPGEGAFFDPNAFRVVQVPWRFDGSERYLGATPEGGPAAPDGTGPWSRLPDEGGVVPVRVRVPVTGASEEAIAAVRAFVVVTEEHSIYAPTPFRSPLTATTAAPLPLPSRVIARSPERASISRYALRVVEERGLRRVPTPGDVAGGVRGPTWPDPVAGDPPADTVAFGRVAVGSVSGASYESAAGFAVEVVGSGAAAFALTLEAEAGPQFSSFATGYTVSFDDGVAYLAVPNVPGLRVGYDDVSIEAFDFVSDTWGVVANAYEGPARSAAPTAASRAVAVAWDVMIGEALSAMGGHGVARSLVAINIAKELGALRQGAADTLLVEAPIVVPADPAFYDPNRYRLVEIPWTLSRLMPRGDSGDPGVFLHADPRDPARGGMRLRIVVPVEGLPRERIADVRAFVSSVERVAAWTTPVIGSPRIQMSRTRVVTAPSMAADARSDAGPSVCLSLAAWGRNAHGQADVPTDVAVRRARAGLFHGLAIAADGSLLAWGRNDHGQGAIPVELPRTEYLAVATGTVDSFAVARDGSMYMWGGSFSGVVVQEAFGVVDVRVEDAHHVLLDKEGRARVRGWTFAEEDALEAGQGHYAQVGTSRGEVVLLTRRGLFGLGHLNVPPSIRHADDIVSISVGEFGAAAAHVDGTVTWWQVGGAPDVVRRSYDGAAIDVAVGRDFVAILFDDGSVQVAGPDRNRVGLIPPLPGVIRDLEAGFDYLVALVEREDCR
jgi:hypothetical protein